MGIFKKKEKEKIPPVQGSTTGYSTRFNPPPNPGSRNLPQGGFGPDGQPLGAAPGNQWQRYNPSQQYQPQQQQPPQQPPYGAAGYGGGAPGGYDRSAYGAGSGPGMNGTQGGYGQPVQASQQALEDEYGATRAPGSGAYDEYGAGGSQAQAQEERTESDEEVEAIKQQMRFTKQESLSATRNALRMAREAEETATNSMMRLGDQSEKLADTERNLDMSKAHAARAEDNAKEIVALNRSIFRPNIQFDKKAKRAAEEARIVNRHVEEREEREALRQEALQARNRVERTLGAPGSGVSKADRFGAGRFGIGKSSGGAGAAAADPQATKLAQRSRYQFEATASDDELEDELDDNMDEIGRLAGKLHTLGVAMGNEIDQQNARITRLGEKTSTLDTKIYSGTQRMANIK